MYKDTLKKHLLGTTLTFTLSSWGLIKDYAHKRERKQRQGERTSYIPRLTIMFLVFQNLYWLQSAHGKITDIHIFRLTTNSHELHSCREVLSLK